MPSLKRLLRYNFWFEHDVVGIDSAPYLERWFMYFFGFTFRVHKFYRGDDDRAPHTHPWGFWTFPLRTYHESVWHHGVRLFEREVKAFRPHWRSAKFEHIVKGSSKMPFYTLVVTGRKSNSWGFYPSPGQFVYWRKFSVHAKA